MIDINQLRKGIFLELDNTIYQVTDYQHFKTGKGNSEARIRLKLKELKSGINTERVFQTSDRLPRAIIERRPSQFLYSDGELFYFMDSESFEQVAFNRNSIPDTVPFLKEGMELTLVVHRENAISVELPVAVDLKVVEAEPGYKGDTASAITKMARLETGHTVQVPLFVNEGDTIKIDTRTGGYLSKG